MIAPQETFEQAYQRRNAAERKAVVETYTVAADAAEDEGFDIFTPTFDSAVMNQRQHVLAALKNRGWKLTHWSVVTHQNAAYGYPVFEK